MKIWVLSEDTSLDSSWESEHGLSLYIEALGFKILFDTGQGEIFARNARRFGLSLSDVDFAVVSHGHYDHGGGLWSFLERNTKAKIYIRKEAFLPHYSLRGEKLHFIGLDPALKTSGRMEYTEECTQILPGVTLYTCKKTERKYQPKTNQRLFMQKAEKILPDDFLHEQHLLIEENGKGVLFSGCAHCGMLSALSAAPASFQTVWGGMHLAAREQAYAMTDAELLRFAQELETYPVQYFTGHCTGRHAFVTLQTVLGKRLKTFSAGEYFVI